VTDNAVQNEPINAARALELLAAVVQGREDYVYEKVENEDGEGICVYIHNGQPSCLVGHALVAGGVLTVDQLAAVEISTSAEDLVGDFPAALSAGAGELLAQAQAQQDNGRPWADALAAAAAWYDVQ
jgi:hypothetical protein